jgi:hypothetical protein
MILLGVIYAENTMLFLRKNASIFPKVWYRIIEDKENTYLEKANMQKFDFLKNGRSIFTQK